MAIGSGGWSLDSAMGGLTQPTQWLAAKLEGDQLGLMSPQYDWGGIQKLSFPFNHHNV